MPSPQPVFPRSRLSVRAGPASFGVWGRWQRKLYLFLLLGEGPQVARTARVLTALEVFL